MRCSTHNAYAARGAIGFGPGPAFELEGAFLPLHKREPVQKEADAKDEGRTLQHLAPERRRAAHFQAGHHKGHGIAYGKEEKGKHQVGRREAVPFGMGQRAEDVLPGAGAVDQDHKGHGGATENVECGVTCFQNGGFGINGRNGFVNPAFWRLR